MSAGDGGGDDNQSQRLGGTFWLAGQPDITAIGMFDVTTGVLRIERELVSCLVMTYVSPSVSEGDLRRDTKMSFAV